MKDLKEMKNKLIKRFESLEEEYNAWKEVLMQINFPRILSKYYHYELIVETLRDM